jgi:hypothetical protein
VSATSALFDRSQDLDDRFRVAIAYEDHVVGRVAMDTYQRLVSEFGSQFDFHLNIWRFDLFRAPNFMGEAVRIAADANAVILATHQRDELPEMIKRWVDAWIPQKRGRTAVLIALFDFDSELSGVSFPTFDYLKSAANGVGIDFLVRQTHSVKSRPPSLPSFDEPTGHLPLEGWGLND